MKKKNNNVLNLFNLSLENEFEENMDKKIVIGNIYDNSKNQKNQSNRKDNIMVVSEEVPNGLNVKFVDMENLQNNKNNLHK